MDKLICGNVTKGKGKGRKLGFPTVNIELGGKIESGVYKGEVITHELRTNGKRIGTKKWLAGIFVSPNKGLVEAHLIGFSGNLCGKKVEVNIGDKIREVRKFENDGKLKKQIEKDIELITHELGTK